jgi:hypothetical protein
VFQFDVRELQAWARKMGASGAEIDKAMIRAVTEACRQGADIARRILRANGSFVTGGLHNSITHTPASGSGGTIVGEYGPRDKYPGSWVEFGRKPVHARQGGKLVFQIKGQGPYLYRKSVRAAPARPFMAPSAQQVKPILQRLVRSYVRAAVGRMV